MRTDREHEEYLTLDYTIIDMPRGREIRTMFSWSLNLYYVPLAAAVIVVSVISG